MGLPLVGNDEYLKKELKILNPLGRGDRRAKSENQNLPKMENRKAEAAAGLPMVGTECSHIHRKETRRTTRPATRFHDHLVLESKSHLMIILQLENASVRSDKTGTRPVYSREVGQGRLTALPKAYSIAINDPQLAQRASVRECCRQPPDIAEHSRFILALESEDDDPGMLARWVGANV